MGSLREQREGQRGRGRGSAGPKPAHPMLALQRSVGNRAVTQLVQRTSQVQRRDREYVSSGVALAVIDKIYKGKCDATFDDVPVKRSSSPGLLAKDITITFECGPQRFVFSTTVPWFGDRFPWDIKLATGSTAWLTDKVSKAMDTINDHWDDEGGGFWDAHKTVKAALKYDLDRYCPE